MFGHFSRSKYSHTHTHTVLLLPPGAGTAQAFKRVVENLNQNDVRYVAISFPGRGKTVTKHEFGNSFECTLKCVEEFVDLLKLNKFDVYGISFGTMVIDRILNNDALSNKINDVFLVFPGEYFSNFIRFLLKTLFLPAKINLINKLYYKILSIKLASLKFINPNEILNQWFDTLSFKVSSNPITKPTTIYLGNDKIATYSSLQKIKQKYENSKVLILNELHPFDNNDVQRVIGATIPVYL